MIPRLPSSFRYIWQYPVDTPLILFISYVLDKSTLPFGGSSLVLMEKKLCKLLFFFIKITDVATETQWNPL